MKITIHPEIFDLFPNFVRGVVVATGVTNHEQNPALEAQLRAAEENFRKDPRLRDFKSLPRVKAWLDAFTQLGLNPNQVAPSIAQLAKRAANGAKLPFISSLVALFNIQSLEAKAPCGGDDLAAVTGNLCLRLASGSECYIPLGKPDQIERPSPGEIIYGDSAGQVLCRALCWRNSHQTRIQPTTSNVAINVDGLPPVGSDEVVRITEQLAASVRQHCGGAVRTFILSRDCPEADFDLPVVGAVQAKRSGDGILAANQTQGA